ncbi:MAG: DUF4189 domain-containing protein [Gemmataceae bacterium]|nr:DUF4189 domain-containing protein [Gemmataceae bacterium]
MSLRSAIVLAALTLFAAPQARAQVRGFSDEWAAIAFSPSTGKVGMGWKSPFKGLVEQAALAKCDAKDAEIVANVSPGWAVLVISEDNKFAAVTAHNGTWKPLYEQAKRDLRKYTKKRAVRAIVVCSGDFKPLDFDIPVPPPALYKAGQEVSAWWNGKWYDASVTAVDEGKYKITYAGYDSKWDEWVGADRLKAR